MGLLDGESVKWTLKWGRVIARELFAFEECQEDLTKWRK